MSTAPDLLAILTRALVPEWEEQRRVFNGVSVRRCIHCQGTSGTGHEADCAGVAARAALEGVAAELTRLQGVERAAREVCASMPGAVADLRAALGSPS